jgi:O-antigen chain-terminating methyltransferase
LEQTTPARLEALQNQLIQQDERFRLSERNVRRLAHLIETRDSPQILDQPEVRQKRARAKARKQPLLDYFWFQERFRGDEAEIKRKQETYLPYFRGRKRVVDLGCGRGEFLELMRENGICAQGVELNRDMVLLAREKGLDVVQTDLFDYLVSLPPHSLDGIFCAQVVEHLTPEQLLELIDLARLKLCPGSPLVLETINPACLTALARYFFQDLTHRQPIHPQALKFLLESRGFQPLELLYLAPVECSLPRREWPGLSTSEQAQFERCIDILNEVIFGYQDYAAIGSLHTT